MSTVTLPVLGHAWARVGGVVVIAHRPPREPSGIELPSMGLDVFAARSPERRDKRLTRWDRRAFAKADVQLAGGMYSGAPDSFRGKLYDGLVEHITGVSLYERWIPPETVRAMSEALERCDPDEAINEYGSTGSTYERTAFDVAQLRAFFRVCAKRKLGLVGWW